MASTGPRPHRPEGRIIPLYHLDVHVEVRRLGAAALDLLMLVVVQTWINDVFGITHVTGGSPFHPISGGYVYFTSATTIDPPWLALLVVVFFSVQEALFGATCGKLMAELRVVDLDGTRPTLGAVLVRNILRLIDFWPLLYLIGIVSALISPRRQRLGDRVARTAVVRAQSAPLAYRPPAAVRRRALGLTGTLVLFVAFCLGFSYYGRPPLVIAGLVNTNALFSSTGVASYALGSPHWGSGTVTYPMQYRTIAGHRSCRGSITLRWGGFFDLGGGWLLSTATTGRPCLSHP